MPLALIIEDDEDISQIYSVMLRDVGFDAEVVFDGSSALEWLAAMSPDLIILDLNLPVVSGVEVLRQVRADERLAHAIVIIASANPQMSDEVSDLADLTLLKPISFDHLRDLIARLM